MKTKLRHLLLTLALLALSTINYQLSTAQAQGTAFTYQGRLNTNGSPVNGSYDLTFWLFNTNIGGSYIAGPVTNSATGVTNGLFTTAIDFGPGVFTGGSNWLQIAVRTNGSGSFTTLAPRQQVTPVPYALTAGSANNLADLSVQPNVSSGAPNLIGGSPNNFVAGGVIGATIGGGGATNLYGFVVTNSVAANFGTIGGGCANLIQTGAADATIGGGDNNQIQASATGSTIAGGEINQIQTGAYDSTVGGGYNNLIQNNATDSTIGGGDNNQIQTGAYDSTIGGGVDNTNYASGSMIGGGIQNQIQTGAADSTIGGGYKNSIQTNASYSFLGGGTNNSIQTNATASFLGGGSGNSIQTSASASFLGGGFGNSIQASATASFLGGGFGNSIQTNASSSVLGGGGYNSIQTNAYESVICGGKYNTNTGNFAVIPGGYQNIAGSNSFAAGSFAQATNTGAFVWGDDSVSTPVSSTNANSWTVRASGGVRFFSNSGMTAGVILAPGGGSFANLSDRNAKEAFEPVNAQTVLDGVAALPLSTWKYKSQDASIRHIGPMAQDFKAAFGVGESDTGITTVDEDGVALAAIQGLNQKLENEAKAKDAEIESLKARLEKLEQVINAKTGGGQ